VEKWRSVGACTSDAPSSKKFSSIQRIEYGARICDTRIWPADVARVFVVANFDYTANALSSENLQTFQRKRPGPFLTRGFVTPGFAVLQMQEEGGKAVNPFPAIYYTAQRAPDLINGAQQDIHEFWMSLKDLLNEDMHSKV
jgi:hypothetical protein